jgi:peptidoglycan/xylan/chitin deacetylase (PgdA/CDA1 family)
MTSQQIQELIKQGFTVGSHSCDHPEYRFLSLDEQIEQTRKSTEEIISKFNLDYKVFAFPFTDYEVKKLFFDKIFMKENPICEITFGCAGLKHDSVKNNLQRIPIEKSEYKARTILATEYLYYLLKIPFGKNVISRK